MPLLTPARKALLQKLERYLGLISVTRNSLGVAAVISAVAAPGSTVTVLLMLIVAVMMLTRPVRAGIDFFRGGNDQLPLLMGFAHVSRILVVLAAVVITYPREPSWVTTLAFGLVCISTILEQAMTRPVRSAMPVAANLEGWQIRLPSTDTANAFQMVNTFGVLAAVCTALLALPVWPVAVLGAVGVVLGCLVGSQVVRYQLTRSRFDDQLPATLNALNPAFAFHWQAPAGTAYQASMWLPYLERIQVPYFVLVRTAANFTEVAKMTKAPIILRTGLEDLDSVVCPSLKAVFYCNTAVRNSHMIRFPHLTHIQLNHGDSDKIASVSPTFRQYDKNFVAGQAAIDRFDKYGVATRRDQFVIVGRPQLEHVLPAQGPIDTVATPTVLYSPTWSGFYEDSDYSSLGGGPVIVQTLLDRGCTVVFRPHPYSRRHPANSRACDQIHEMLTADARTTGRVHLFGDIAERQMSIVDCFNASDAMVSDVSSVVSDYLFSGKPFAMAAVRAHGPAFREEFPVAEAAYVFDVTDGLVEGLEAAVVDLLGADSMRATRLALRTYYLSDAPAENYAELFLSEARRAVA